LPSQALYVLSEKSPLLRGQSAAEEVSRKKTEEDVGPPRPKRRNYLTNLASLAKVLNPAAVINMLVIRTAGAHLGFDPLLDRTGTGPFKRPI
jgi:hypothetical protein